MFLRHGHTNISGKKKAWGSWNKKGVFLKGKVEKKNVVAEHFENSFLCFNNSY